MIDYTNDFFFFNDTATTEIYTLSLHDALPISLFSKWFWRSLILFSTSTLLNKTGGCPFLSLNLPKKELSFALRKDRKSTRLNSSHANISYAVFCLKKKNKP